MGCGEGVPLALRAVRSRARCPPGPAAGVADRLPADIPAAPPARVVRRLQRRVRDALHAIKYGGEQRLAEPLGAAIAGAGRPSGAGVDCLVHVPVHADRRRVRGYDQAELIARRGRAALASAPSPPSIAAAGDDRPVRPGPRDRAANVEGAFRVRPGARTGGPWSMGRARRRRPHDRRDARRLRDRPRRRPGPGRLGDHRRPRAMSGGPILGTETPGPEVTHADHRQGQECRGPERVRDYAERKLHRLERLLDDRTDAIVEFSNEHASERRRRPHRRGHAGHRRPGPAQPRRSGSATRPALDTVVDKVERQAVDHKSKPRIHARPEEEKQILRPIADGTAEPGRERRIVKTKRFAIEPMFEEDAMAAMEELGHRFFVFVNAETERIAILYPREDGDYGLIEPVVGGEYDRPGEGGRPSAGRRATVSPRPAPVLARLAGDSPASTIPRGSSRRRDGTAPGAG